MTRNLRVGIDTPVVSRLLAISFDSSNQLFRKGEIFSRAKLERVARGSGCLFDIKPKMLDGNFVIDDCGGEFGNLLGGRLADFAVCRSGTYYTGISHVTSLRKEAHSHGNM